MSTKSVFLLLGDEDFFKEEWLQRTKQAFFKKDKNNSVDFNQFYTGDIDLSDVLASARTRPLFAKKRLIILKNIEKIPSSLEKDKLVDYSRSPSSDTILVLEANIKEKKFLADKSFAALSKISTVVTSKKLYGKDLKNWIIRRLALRKKNAGPQVAELLEQLKGNNLKAIDQEVEKIDIYTGSRDLVTKEDVQKLIGRDITGRLYDMLDAISTNDKEKALAIGFDFKKKDIPSIVSLFCWNLRRLLRAKEYLKQGWAPQKVENKLGMRKAQVLYQVNKFKTSWIKKALLELTDFDLRSKTSGFRERDLDWQIVLTKLLARLNDSVGQASL